jgi:hypothetical protein
MKVMVIGDTHGNTRSILPKIELAGELGIQKILQVGDFGLWDHFFDGVVYLDAIQTAAEDNNLTVHAIGGNHENWDHWNWYVENLPTSHRWAMLRSRIAIAPRFHWWKWDNKYFTGIGGAVSVDREWRLQKEADSHDGPKGRYAKGTGARTLYWPNEQFTDEDVHKVRMHDRPTDYLITHDCSNNTPWYRRLKADADSQEHRRRIDEVLKMTKPKLHFHGHMHTKYDWLNFVGESNGEPIYVQTYGLENDSEFYSWGILDTQTDKFSWRGVEKYEVGTE